ncbi:MAG: protein kinase [Candidatus Promineifilaceae bacterium]|nr:protein kinase [Candidatus Promineifilaceae bacterium]
MSSSTASSPDRFAGSLLADRYRLEAELGRGGMGMLYRGVDTQTGEAVAVKSLKPAIVAGNPELVARFVREGEALRKLNHPNIVKMVAAVSDNEQHYLIMEYIPGGDLRRLLDQEAPLSISQVIEMGLDLADALTRAHRLNIIHRDLKPANVLIGDDGSPKLTDFGTAHLAGVPALTQTGMIVGTVAYLSPEACTGERLDDRADIWAFGVMLFEMLVGKRPFAGDTLAATLVAICNQPVPDISQLRPDVPDGLADLVYRMLHKERLSRIPSVRLVGVELEALLQGDGRPDMTPAPAATRPRDASPFATPTPETRADSHNLPPQPTPFVGREAELTELTQLLSPPDTHLVTILGAGGMGKSRLALALGESQREQFPDGVYFVPLAGLSDPEGIVPTIAEATGQLFSQERGQLLDFLREKQLLLLLDNFEHLLGGVDIVSEIMGTAPQVKILATSRVKLGVQGEHLFPLAGMDFPEMAQIELPAETRHYSAKDSVRLFIQSARRTKPGFELEAEDAGAVARICRLVQGMPLAIILAAAWMEMLTPSEIAAEIENSLDFLEGDAQGVPDRHRSMRAVLDHTWHQLNDREQQLMAFISIFRGGFTREAVQAVTNGSLRELMAVTSKSLLQRSPDGRFHIHELQRQYAAERLAGLRGIESQTAEEWIREQHSAYYCALLDKLAPDLKSAAVLSARDQIQNELLNMRLAWNWAVAQARVEYLAQGLEGLGLYFWYQGLYREGENLAGQAAERLRPLLLPTSSPPSELIILYARLRSWQGFLNRAFGQDDDARRYCQEALDTLDRPELDQLDNRPERAFTLMGLGRGYSRSQREKAEYLMRESLAQYQSLEDLWGSIVAHSALGSIASDAFDYLAAETHCLEAWRLSQQLGHKLAAGWTSMQLAWVIFYQGRLVEAEDWFRQGVELCRRYIHDWPGHCAFLNGLAYSLIFQGRYDEARGTLLESARHARNHGWFAMTNLARYYWSEALLHLGRYEETRHELEEILTFWRQQDRRADMANCRYLLALSHMVLGANEKASTMLREANECYREINRQDWLSRTLIAQSIFALQNDQLPKASHYLREALELTRDIHDHTLAIQAMPALALYYATQRASDAAVELYALAAVQPYVANSAWYQEVVGKRIAAIELPHEVEAAAEERGRVRDLWQTIEEFSAQLAA